MYCKLVKNGNGYKIIRISENGEKTIIVKLERKGKLFIQSEFYDEYAKQWKKCKNEFFMPEKLSEYKRIYNIK